MTFDARSDVLIAVDWGTSSCRVWALDADGGVLDEARSKQGTLAVSKTAKSDGAADRAVAFEAALIETAGSILDHYPDAPILACGMVGSTIGWVEAGYRELPAEFAPARADLASVRMRSGREVLIVPGLRVAASGANGWPDVIRGEETQLAGVLGQIAGTNQSRIEGEPRSVGGGPTLRSDRDDVRSDPADAPTTDGVSLVGNADNADATERAGKAEERTIVLPGTHTKWVRTRGHEVETFTTVMTGELFGTLMQHSILGAPAKPSDDFDEATFQRGLAIGSRTDAGSVAARIFAARTLGMDASVAPTAIGDLLSGILIGDEIAGQLGDSAAGSDRAPIVCGDGALVARYVAGFRAAGIEPVVISEDATRAGLMGIARRAGLIGEVAAGASEERGRESEHRAAGASDKDDDEPSTRQTR